MTTDAIKVGLEWEDSKGFKWEVFENLFFGKWRVVCRGRSDHRCNDGCRHDHCKGGASRVGEMSGKEIRAELEDQWKRKLNPQNTFMSNNMTISEMARAGGLARAKKLSKKQRVAIARKAGSAPKKARKQKK